MASTTSPTRQLVYADADLDGFIQASVTNEADPEPVILEM